MHTNHSYAHYSSFYVTPITTKCKRTKANKIETNTAAGAARSSNKDKYFPHQYGTHLYARTHKHPERSSSSGKSIAIRNSFAYTHDDVNYALVRLSRTFGFRRQGTQVASSSIHTPTPRSPRVVAVVPFAKRAA